MFIKGSLCVNVLIKLQILRLYNSGVDKFIFVILILYENVNYFFYKIDWFFFIEIMKILSFVICCIYIQK